MFSPVTARSRYKQLLIALLAVCAAADTAYSQKSQPDQVLQCFSDKCFFRKTSWNQFQQESPPCLKPSRIWWSQKKVLVPATLVTQLSIDRLPQLLAQCSLWLGPLAAAVYMPLYNPSPHLTNDTVAKIQQAVEAMEDTFLQAESRRKCQLRMMLVYELFDQVRATALYPVNSLRNYARLMADTDLIANIDVDMVPSASLSQDLCIPQNVQYYERGSKNRTMYVIPAFETHCGGPSFADEIGHKGKHELTINIQEECLGPFRAKVAAAAHNATDFRRWFQAQQAYAITYHDTFEPWFISDRMLTAWYDVRYRGYGKNKIVQSAYMHHVGFTLSVHPSGFLVHRPHTESQARKQWVRVKFKSRKDARLLRDSLYAQVENLYEKHQAEMANGSYAVAVDDTLMQCLGKLPWWSNYTASALGAPKTMVIRSASITGSATSSSHSDDGRGTSTSITDVL